MKKLLLLTLFFPFISSGQILLETLEGQEILITSDKLTDSLRIIVNVNTSVETLQFKGYVPINPKGAIITPSCITFGYKIKPTEGVSSLFSKGKINSSMNFNAGYSSKLNQGRDGFFSILLGYNIEKSTMFYPTRPYESQVDEFIFKGGTLDFIYSLLIKGRYFLTTSLGYARKNNYSDLTKIEIDDFVYTPDPTEWSNIIRGYGSVVNARIGDYKKFDRYPFKIGITFLPSEAKAKATKILPGWSAYYACDFGDTMPLHKIGVIGFVTKQDEKTGVRTPTLGLGFQLKDFTNNLKSDSSIGKRISVNFSASLSLL